MLYRKEEPFLGAGAFFSRPQNQLLREGQDSLAPWATVTPVCFCYGTSTSHSWQTGGGPGPSQPLFPTPSWAPPNSPIPTTEASTFLGLGQSVTPTRRSPLGSWMGMPSGTCVQGLMASFPSWLAET